MNQLSNFYQDKLLEDLHLDKLPEAEQQVAVQMIADRFQKVIVHTMLRSLSAEQKQQFEAALQNPETMEDKVSELAESIPGLGEQIDVALTGEYELLKLAMSKR